MEIKGKLVIGKQFVRFVVSGSIAAVVGVMLMFFFVGILKLWYLTATVVSFFLTFIVAFFLQKFWAFQNKEFSLLPKQASFSFSVAVLNFFLNIVFMSGLVGQLKIHYFIAQFITYGLFGLIDFFIYKFLIFKV